MKAPLKPKRSGLLPRHAKPPRTRRQNISCVSAHEGTHFHVFAEVEAKQAARECGASRKGTTRQMWERGLEARYVTFPLTSHHMARQSVIPARDLTIRWSERPPAARSRFQATSISALRVDARSRWPSLIWFSLDVRFRNPHQGRSI